MKAIGYKKAGPISHLNALEEFETDIPEVGPLDLLVEVKGISVNPVDVKLRASKKPENGFQVLGYDAAGIVKKVGNKVSKFKPGDEVFYAGDFTRAGTNSAFHLVDERIVGKKPKSLNFAESAAFPLTSITAWELLFDSLNINLGEGKDESLLIIGAAGGVGSILIQLAKKLTRLKVIATASRPKTTGWVKKMGADEVINHRESLVEQLEKLDIQPSYVISLNATEQHFPAIIELIKPRGHIAIIDDPKNLDISAIKLKALSFSWEFMFARSLFQTEDMVKQHELLNRVSELIDEGSIISTMSNNWGKISVENLKKAHELQESGKLIGKQVLEGFHGG